MESAEARLEYVTEQLRHIEKANRRLRVTTLVALVLAIVACVTLLARESPFWPLVAARQGNFSSLKVKHLFIEDDGGGGPAVYLSDSNGHLRAILTAGSGGSVSFALFDENAKNRGEITANKDKSAIILSDANGFEWVEVSTDKEMSVITLFDQFGVPTLSVPDKSKEKKKIGKASEAKLREEKGRVALGGYAPRAPTEQRIDVGESGKSGVSSFFP